MKAILFIFVTLAASFSMAALGKISNHSVVIEGVIKSVHIGEFDPHVIGEACLVEVQVNARTSVGLLTDYESCLDYEKDLYKGRGISVVTDKKGQITGRLIIALLKERAQAQYFYEVEFGNIENGLAD